MGTRIQIRRDTSTNWSVNNPILALGEPGLETDTQIVKYGDGVTAWNSLPYSNLNSLSDFTTADLKENSANLYYSNARVYANVDLLDFATNSQLSAYATNNQLTLYATNAQLGTYATNNQLSLYATNAQLGTYATNNQLALYATNSQLSSYATNAQISTYATLGNVAALTTANIAEDSNLYYSNDRVQQVLLNPYTNFQFNNTITVYTAPTETIANLIRPAGSIVFNSNTNTFLGYNGSHWVSLG